MPAHAAYCVENWSSPSDRHAYAVFLLLSTYVGPIIAIIASYALIGRSLCVGSSTPTGSVSSRRVAVASTCGSRGDGPGVAGGGPPGRAVALAGHGGLFQGGGESWPCSPGGGGGGGGGLSTIQGPVIASRCSSREPVSGGLQVPGRLSSSSTSSSGRKKAATAGLLVVAGYSAPADVAAGATAADGEDHQRDGTVTIGPMARRRRHPMTGGSTRSNPVAAMSSDPYRDAINRSRRSVVRLLVTIVVVFVASWLPYNVVSLRVDLSLDAGEARILPFALWLGHAHSAVNPVVYWFFNKTFRHCVRNALQRGCGIFRRSRDHLHASQYV